MLFKKTKSIKLKSVFFFISVLISVTLITYEIFNQYQNIFIKQEMPVKNNLENKKETLEVEVSKNTKSKQEDIVKNKQENTFEAKYILEIPQINLSQQLPDINSHDNDVNKNIYIVKESTFPDISNSKQSHVILAAHSGYGKVAYFKKLSKLKPDDLVNLYYLNHKYTYKITKSYEIIKNGKMSFKKEDDNDITLITCIKNTNRQIIYKGILIFY